MSNCSSNNSTPRQSEKQALSTSRSLRQIESKTTRQRSGDADAKKPNKPTRTAAVLTIHSDVTDSDTDSGEDSDEEFSRRKAFWQLTANAHDGMLRAALRFGHTERYEEVGCGLVYASTLTTFVIYLLVCGVQIVVFLWFVIYVTERREDPFEVDMPEEIALLTQAVADNTMLDMSIPSNSALIMKCYRDHSVAYTQVVMVSVWIMRMGNDVTAAFFAVYASFKMKVCDSTEMEYQADGITMVHRVTLHFKWFSLLVVQIPRTAIALAFGYSGAKFLMFASSLGTLIMKAVGMAFCLSFDSFMFTALASQAFVQEVKVTKLVYKLSHHKRLGYHWSFYGSTWVRLTMVLTLAWLFTRVLYNDVASLRWACNAYEERFQQVPSLAVTWVNTTCENCGFHDYFGHVFMY